MGLDTSDILLCSQDKLFVKSVYGTLRDCGYDVDVVEHPSEAVRVLLKKNYLSIVLDSRDFGLSALDAINIIKTIQPNTHTIVIGMKKNEFDIETFDSMEALHHLKDLFKGLKIEKTK